MFAKVLLLEDGSGRDDLRRPPHLAPRTPDIFLGLLIAPVSALAGGSN